MYEDRRVIESKDKPGWVAFKAHPDVCVLLNDYLARNAREVEKLQRSCTEARRRVTRRVKTICMRRGWPHPDQSGLRQLSWSYLQLRHTDTATALPKGISNISADVYHWQHLINAVALCCVKQPVQVLGCRVEVLIAAKDYLAEDDLEMYEVREQLLKQLDVQLDTIDWDETGPPVQSKRELELELQLKQMKEQLDELQQRVQPRKAGAKTTGIRARKGRSE